MASDVASDPYSIVVRFLYSSSEPYIAIVRGQGPLCIVYEQ